MVREALQVTEVAIKLSALGIKNALALSLAYAKENPKVKGKTSLDRLLREGKELKIIALQSKDVGQFKELAKQYGVLFAVIKDKAQNEKVDVMFKAEDVAKLNRIYEQLGYAIPKVTTADRKKRPNPPSIRRQLADAREESLWILNPRPSVRATIMALEKKQLRRQNRRRKKCRILLRRRSDKCTNSDCPSRSGKPKSKPNLKKPLRRKDPHCRKLCRMASALPTICTARGRLGSHITSGNAALVLQTLPQARAVLTAKDWDKFGRRVNKGAKGIPQLVRVNGYYNVGSIFDVSMTYGNKPYPIPEIKPEQMDKAIKELERLSPVNIIFQNEGVVGYDAEQHAIVFPTAMPQREVLARLPAEIVIATAEQHTPGISQAPYLRKTAVAVSVEFCGRFSLPMPDTTAAVLDGMDTHIPPGEERKTLEEIRELSVTIGDTVEKGLGLQRGQSAPQRDEAR